EKVGNVAATHVEAAWEGWQRTVKPQAPREAKGLACNRLGSGAFLDRLMRPGSRPPRPRGLFIAALLLLTLALAGAIALQAYRNFLGHKATAERVLSDYARLAAARFANRTEMAFYY